eukprot:SAG31_NODE_33936_length_338_cov_1.083682_1_plen_28_part_10
MADWEIPKPLRPVKNWWGQSEVVREGRQ